MAAASTKKAGKMNFRSGRSGKNGSGAYSATKRVWECGFQKWEKWEERKWSTEYQEAQQSFEFQKWEKWEERKWSVFRYQEGVGVWIPKVGEVGRTEVEH